MLIQLTNIEFGPNKYNLTYDEFKDQKFKFGPSKKETKEEVMAKELKRIYSGNTSKGDPTKDDINSQILAIMNAMYAWWIEEKKKELLPDQKYSDEIVTETYNFNVKNNLIKFYEQFTKGTLNYSRDRYPTIKSMFEGIYLNLKYNTHLSLAARKGQFITLVAQLDVCSPGRYNTICFIFGALSLKTVSIPEYLRLWRRGIVENLVQGESANDPNAIRKSGEYASHNQLAVLEFADDNELQVYTEKERKVTNFDDQYKRYLSEYERSKFWRLYEQKHTPEAAFRRLLSDCTEYLYRQIEDLKPVTSELSREEFINALKNIFIPIDHEFPVGLLTLTPGVECDLAEGDDLLPSEMRLRLQDTQFSGVATQNFVKIVTKAEFCRRFQPYLLNRLAQAGIFSGRNGVPPRIYPLATGDTLYTFETKHSSETKHSPGVTWIRSHDAIYTLEQYVTEKFALNFVERRNSIPSFIWIRYLKNKIRELANTETKAEEEILAEKTKFWEEMQKDWENLAELSSEAFIEMLEVLKDLSVVLNEREKSFQFLGLIFEKLSDEQIAAKLRGCSAKYISELINPILRYRKIIPENPIRTCLHALEKYAVDDAGSLLMGPNYLRIAAVKRAEYYLLVSGAEAQERIDYIIEETTRNHETNRWFSITKSRLVGILLICNEVLQKGQVIAIAENKLLKWAIRILLLLFLAATIGFTAGGGLALGGIALFFFTKITGLTLICAFVGSVLSLSVASYLTYKSLESVFSSADNNLPYQLLEDVDVDDSIIISAAKVRADELYSTEAGFSKGVTDEKAYKQDKPDTPIFTATEVNTDKNTRFLSPDIPKL